MLDIISNLVYVSAIMRIFESLSKMNKDLQDSTFTF